MNEEEIMSRISILGKSEEMLFFSFVVFFLFLPLFYC